MNLPRMVVVVVVTWLTWNKIWRSLKVRYGGYVSSIAHSQMSTWPPSLLFTVKTAPWRLTLASRWWRDQQFLGGKWALTQHVTLIECSTANVYITLVCVGLLQVQLLYGLLTRSEPVLQLPNHCCLQRIVYFLVDWSCFNYRIILYLSRHMYTISYHIIEQLSSPANATLEWSLLIRLSKVPICASIHYAPVNVSLSVSISMRYMRRTQGFTGH